MQLPPQSSKRRRTLNAVTADNKLMNEAVRMWLGWMKQSVSENRKDENGRWVYRLLGLELRQLISSV